MGALGNPKIWAPYMNTKDCTQGFCSLACPKWCYIIFPPPPPIPFPDDKSQTSNFSPLVIAIIGILASAFLLVSYYAIISKYCGNSDSARRSSTQPPNEEIEEEANNYDDHDPSQHGPWFISTTGLDEALINKITIVNYKKGDGLIGSTDCSVCLGEFLEDETLRLLPKCSHAFHVACIDTWLKSHSNCPLCRANIVSTFAQPVNLTPSLVVDYTTTAYHLHDYETFPRNEVVDVETSSSGERSGNSRKTPFRTFSDLGSFGLRGNTEIVDLRCQEEGNMLKRSISMDHSHETRISISDILRFDHGEVCQVENCELHDQHVKLAAGESSKPDLGNASSSNSRSGVLHSVMNSVSMKQSFSSGRILFTKHGRGSNVVTPV